MKITNLDRLQPLSLLEARMEGRRLYLYLLQPPSWRKVKTRRKMVLLVLEMLSFLLIYLRYII